MIAVDSNVLLRYLLADDEIQAKKAAKLIDSHPAVFLSHVVLVETVWTLKGKKYKQTPEQIDNVITALFEEASIVLQDEDLVWRALVDYRAYAVERKLKVDFPDSLIFHVGKDAAEQHGEKFDGFYTFDINARRAFREAKTP